MAMANQPTRTCSGYHAAVLSGLRVAYVAFDPFPNRKGSGTRIGELATGLAEAGADVTVVTLAPVSNDDPPTGVRTWPIRSLDRNYLARAVSFRDAVGRALVALRPDVIHFRGPFEGQAALGYADSFGARTVFEVNGLPSVELSYHHPSVYRSELETRLDRTERRLLRRADAVFTQSHATERFLRLRGLAARAARVIPNGAHANELGESSRKAGGTTEVLYAGTLAPWQGLPELVSAVYRASRDADVRLTLLGGGQKRWRRELLRRVRRLDLGDRVALRAAVSREELRLAVLAADVCVAPLRRDRRNRLQGSSPIKLYEYMAAGKAVLATRLPCLEEIVSDGHTGLLARPGHTDLALRLGELSRDPSLRQRLGRSARLEILENGTWTHRRAELVGFYREVVLENTRMPTK
jgi:glycosyltransferase involved in cell wall biosynthesis